MYESDFEEKGITLLIVGLLILSVVLSFFYHRFPSQSNRFLYSQTVSSPDNSISGIAVSVNTASLDELTELPGIGAVIAQRIIDYRNSAGPFKEKQDLLQVKGIGEKKLNKMIECIIIE